MNNGCNGNFIFSFFSLAAASVEAKLDDYKMVSYVLAAIVCITIIIIVILTVLLLINTIKKKNTIQDVSTTNDVLIIIIIIVVVVVVVIIIVMCSTIQATYIDNNKEAIKESDERMNH